MLFVVFGCGSLSVLGLGWRRSSVIASIGSAVLCFCYRLRDACEYYFMSFGYASGWAVCIIFRPMYLQRSDLRGKLFQARF